jgi:hypothetical protein
MNKFKKLLEELDYYSWRVIGVFRTCRYEVREFFQKIFNNGVSNRNCFSLDYHLIDYTVRRLEKLKTVSECYPALFESHEAWVQCLDEMKDLKYYLEEDHQAEFRKAHRLFRKHYSSLWY